MGLAVEKRMEWDFIRQLKHYQPETAQEEADRVAMLQAAKQFQKKLLFRENSTAHITSSGFVVNPALSKVLLVYHNLRKTWSWAGGHADGEENLLQVAAREVREETGVKKLILLSQEIATLDIFPVERHVKNGEQISPHLHFSVSYCFICDENQPLQKKVDENSAVGWFPLEYFSEKHFSREDNAVYQKCIHKLKRFK